MEERDQQDSVNTEAAERMHLLGADQESLCAWLVEQGQQRFRADQILQWVFEKQVDTPDEMTNLSKALRAWLVENADISLATVAADSEGVDGTHKLLLNWPDGEAVETVWIPEGVRNTACVSTQVGCPVGCKFCASGLDGLVRNLTAGEIVEQAWHISRLITRMAGDAIEGDADRLTNIVIMGMGEPLANYDEVVRAIRIMNAPWGMNIGARKITLSTVGIPKQIRRLADEGLQINLALSLHAADDALRRTLIPWGNVLISELVDACRYYFDHTGREITLEYVMIEEVNMNARHADALARIVRRLRANVNLLRYNAVPGTPFERPSAASAHDFQQRLRDNGVNAHIRTSRGRDVDAACGQLRRRKKRNGGSA